MGLYRANYWTDYFKRSVGLAQQAVRQRAFHVIWALVAAILLFKWISHA
jgi:hypothetical protein